MIGNDVIDLNLASRESDWQRKGFLDKQFSTKEQEIINASKDSFTMVWLLWSMKESAYKVWARESQNRVFAPLKFECELTSETEGLVYFQDQKFYTSSIIDGYYIFTVALLKKESRTFSSIGSPHRLERDIKNKLAEETNFPAKEIEQKKSENGTPNYYYKGKQLPQTCSISHHGNYGTFSILLD